MPTRLSRFARRTWAAALLAGIGIPLLAVPAAAAGSWTWPVAGELLTRYRNGDDPYAHGQHRGIDLAAPVGAQVVAAAAGTVTFAGTAGSSGLTVSVRTQDGRFDTSYLHLSSIDARAGEGVRRGDRLGAVGITGRRSVDAPHLHFGVRDAGTRHVYHDPLEFLGSPPPPASAPPPGTPVSPLPVSAAARPQSARPFARPLLAPLPAPLMAPGSRGAPLRLPGRTPRAAPTPGRRGAPGAARARSAPAAGSAYAGSPATHGSPARADRPVAPGPDLGVAPEGAAEAGRVPAPGGERDPASGPRTGGLDLGRILAVVGLLLAAATLSRPAGREAAADRGRAAAAALLRPLLGRG